MCAITYDEAKRRTNLKKHGIDLVDCDRVFDAPMLTEDDTRDTYGEQRLKSLCWLAGRVVVLVWTDRDGGPHLISCRYGDKHETQTYFKAFV
jgi:hypothetical protein